jgi:hypothetical protein
MKDPVLQRPRDRAVELPGRRRFLKVLGMTGVLGTLGPALAMAQTASGGAKPAKPAAKRPTKPAAPVAPPANEVKISDDARALASILERRYGKHLNAEQLASVTRDLEGDLQSAQRLRAVKLLNADEPDVVFKP